MTANDEGQMMLVFRSFQHVCCFHRQHPNEILTYPCACGSALGLKYVPARLIEIVCPTCHGRGRIDKKVPKEGMKT